MQTEHVSPDSGDARQDRVQEPPWRLNVQGVEIKSRKPTIVVRDAIKEAGLNPDAGWIAVLKVAGEPKKQVELSSEIDLRHKGIEKLRLTPSKIDNGEAQQPRRVEFALLPGDEDYLDRRGLHWETAIEGQRRWLLIAAYPLPDGYSMASVSVAIEIPRDYPEAQLDMFYCCPAVARLGGGQIPKTKSVETIFGAQYQRWSRHRSWDSKRDNLVTHLALIDESFAREVEQ